LTATAAPPSLDRSLSRRRWLQGARGAVLAAAGVYAFLTVDTVARSREAVREAERYALWHRDPEARRRALEDDFRRGLTRLSRRREADRLAEEAFALELDLLRVRHETAMNLPAAARAFQWYRDAYRLFSPPETPWTRRARLLAPAFKEAWRDEVQRRGLPTTETLWDDEPGLAPDERMVFSARGEGRAAFAQEALRAVGIEARLIKDERPRGAGEGYWLAVRKDRFWEAHEALKAGLDLRVPAVLIESAST